jgi:hypothetical protein
MTTGLERSYSQYDLRGLNLDPTPLCWIQTASFRSTHVEVVKVVTKVL